MQVLEVFEPHAVIFFVARVAEAARAFLDLSRNLTANVQWGARIVIALTPNPIAASPIRERGTSRVHALPLPILFLGSHSLRYLLIKHHDLRFPLVLLSIRQYQLLLLNAYLLLDFVFDPSQ